MSLKDVWKKFSQKNDSENDDLKEVLDVAPLASDAFPVVKMDSERLSAYRAIPLSGLASLGAAFFQMSEGTRTVVQTVTKNVATDEPLYVAFNPKNILGFMRENEYGTVGNIMQVNAQGKQVIAGRMRYKRIDNLPTTETSVTQLPIDPMLMVVAVALMNIEKKLDGIQKSVEEVMQFLKQEKQSKQRGNLNMLTEIMEDYKANCQSETFCVSRLGEVLSIKTSAYQDIDFYQNRIAAELQKKKTIHSAKDAQTILDEITYQFAEYQLACHLFAFSSFLDVLLQRNFDAEHIESMTEKMNAMAERYGALYDDCYRQIAKYQGTAIEAKILGGIGHATKGLGKAIAAIPVVRDGSVDEALISAGDSIEKHNQEALRLRLQGFEVFEDNRMAPFVENLQNVNLLYNTQNAIITDGINMYVLGAA